MAGPTTIQLRRDTAANWTSVNPVLHQGEIGVETDTGKAKVGDGATAWASLGYWDPAAALSQKGAASGIATLDSGTHIPAAQLPAATSGAQGAVKLAGDLGGTASSPQVTGTHLASALPVTQGGTGSTARNFAGLLTPTAVKTSAYTAAAGDFVPCDTTSGSFTVTLPAAPADLTVVGVKQITTGTGNSVTVATGGSDVFNKTGGGTSSALTLQAQGQLYQYKASLGVWYVMSDDLPLAQLETVLLQLSGGTMTGPIAMGSNKITGLASGTAGTDAAAYAQTPAGGNTVTIGQGGTGQAGQQAAINALTGTQSAGTYLRSDGTNATLTVIQAGDLPAPNMQNYTSVGTATWTKPAGAVTVDVFVLSGGSGGGSGRRGAAGTVRCGGGGAAGATLVRRTFAASDLSATVTVTVGDGGAGGAAVTADDTNGNAGTIGSTSSFGSYLAGPLGTAGSGGTASTGTGGTGTLGGPGTGGAGGSASTTGGAGVSVNPAPLGAAGGPSGGGITSGNVAGAGAAGSYSYLGGSASSTYGAGGAVDSTAPTSGTSSGVGGSPGGSPGSGAASITTAAQAGAAAYANSGAGVAGGGASLDGNNSGAGGKGGSGFVRVITHFA